MPKQLSFVIPQHGGKRRGAGRKKRLASEPVHSKRGAINARTPIHITLKLVERMPNLRSPSFLRRFNHAVRSAKEFGLRVQHFTIESNHIHMIAECNSGEELASSMKSLVGRLANVIRRAIKLGRLKVFRSRYHAHVLKTPTEMKYALRYVLFNASHHRKTALRPDQYSTVWLFEKVKELVGITFTQRPPEWLNDLKQTLSEPRSWLQSKGWLRTR